MTRPDRRLSIVTDTIDIGRLIRAEIMTRDWAQTHIEADRRKPVDLPATQKRIWR